MSDWGYIISSLFIVSVCMAFARLSNEVQNLRARIKELENRR